ncbi:helix-turn-helix transcriptional regulator [Comamonas antarctica]|uniref:Transcriptional regulator n=1 Tax=Comamonas antarctica TaxID=2743470 RepID=A0A6N1X4J1_9BURK|nr:transcriptional regulator [Comamonas antarctica]QKV53808.1 transcriptional regulator [Comamonas antarctica]
MQYASKGFAFPAPVAAPAATADRLLFLLKSRGPASTSALAQWLDTSAEAARLQVQKLVSAGLIEARQEPADDKQTPRPGRPRLGRPRQCWALTDAGYARFPDTHAQLTAQLLGSVRQLFGEDGLERLIAQREAEARQLYQQACDAPALPERLAQLAAVRSAEGYMARAEADGADWLLIEDHCPICVAARSCQGFCRSELQLFQEIVGPGAQVTREQHLLAGATRCAYRITRANG